MPDENKNTGINTQKEAAMAEEIKEAINKWDDPVDKAAEAKEKELELEAFNRETAKGPNLSRETIKRFLSSKFVEIREMMVKWIKASFDAAQRLMSTYDDEDFPVRYALAGNAEAFSELTYEQQEMILHDHNKYVRDAAYNNPSLLKELKEREELLRLYREYRKALKSAGITRLTDGMTTENIMQYAADNVRNAGIPLDIIAGSDRINIIPAGYKSPFEDVNTRGLIIKINGRIVSKETYYAFMLKHKEEFLNTYRDKYERKILKAMGWSDEKINMLTTARQRFESAVLSGNTAAEKETKQHIEQGEVKAEAEPEAEPEDPLIKEAWEPNTPVERLVELAKNDDPRVKEAVAQNKNVTTEILDELFGGTKDVLVLKAVALNANTSKDTLDKLAEDSRASVRQAVAANPNTNIETLEKLARDPDEEVAYNAIANGEMPTEFLTQLAKEGECLDAIAKNTHTSEEVLTALAGMNRKDIRALTAANPILSDELLEKMKSDDSRDVRAAVAGNPSTPPEVRKMLIEDPEYMVRLALANNPILTSGELEKLADDPDDRVQEAALNHPNMVKERDVRDERPDPEGTKTHEEDKPVGAESEPERPRENVDTIISTTDGNHAFEEVNSVLTSIGEYGGFCPDYTCTVKDKDGNPSKLTFTYTEDGMKYHLNGTEVTGTRMNTQLYMADKDSLNNVKNDMAFYKGYEELAGEAMKYLNKKHAPITLTYNDNGNEVKVEFTKNNVETREKIYNFFFKNRYLQTHALGQAIGLVKNQTFGAQQKAQDKAGNDL